MTNILYANTNIDLNKDKNISYRTNTTVECDFIKNIKTINIGSKSNITINESSFLNIKINKLEYVYDILANIYIESDKRPRIFTLFNKNIIIPIDIEILCNSTISICGISTNNNIGEDVDGIYSKFIYDKVDVGLCLINRLLSSKLFKNNFLYIKGNNIKNTIEICMVANIKYYDHTNTLTNTEQLLLILTYDYARNSIVIDRQKLDINISNIEFPININECIYANYDNKLNEISIIKFNHLNDVKEQIIFKYNLTK